MGRVGPVFGLWQFSVGLKRDDTGYYIGAWLGNGNGCLIMAG